MCISQEIQHRFINLLLATLFIYDSAFFMKLNSEYSYLHKILVLYGIMFIVFLCCFRKSKMSLGSKLIIFCFFLKKISFDREFDRTSFDIIPYELSHNDQRVLMYHECVKEVLDQGRSYIDESVEIKNCFFSRLSVYTGNGGVLYIKGTLYSMVIHSSMFYNCYCSSKGGAIWFSSKESSLKMLCAKGCSASAGCHFGDIVASQNSYLAYFSFSYCSNISIGQASLAMSSQEQTINNLNSSLNNAVSYSGISIGSSPNFSLTYCSFSNNIVTDSVSLNIYSSSGSIYNSNIVHNYSPTHAIVFLNLGSSQIMYSVFYSNQKVLFCVYSGSLTVYHCNFHECGTFSKLTPVSTGNNNSFTKKQTYHIVFFYSYYCNADNPIINKTPLMKILRSQKHVFLILFEGMLSQI